jgi:SAM-dependent methyltransferase
MILLLLALGCGHRAHPHPASAPMTQPGGHDHSHGHGQGHGKGHVQSGGHAHTFEDPARYVAQWEGPERDAWQQPAGLVAALGITPGMAVADLGTGTGYLLPHLVAAAGPGSVYAVDIEPAMVAWVQARAASTGWTTVTPVLGSAQSTGLPPASLDRAVMINVWHHIEDPVAYGRSVKEALKPGGEFAVVETRLDAPEGDGPPMAMRLSPEAVIAALQSAGLQARRSDWTNPRQYMIIATR